MTKQTSLLVQRQVPGFVREDHPQFVEFLKAYYKFLEQPTNEYKNIKYITDVDLSVDRYENNFFNTYAHLLPKEYKVDKAFLIKNVLPLYLSKGSERSYKFLFRLLFDEEIVVRQLRDNILYTSASRWVKDNSLNVSGVIKCKFVSDGQNKEFYLTDYVSTSDVDVYVNDSLVNSGYGVSKTYRRLIFDNEPSIQITGTANVNVSVSSNTVHGNGTLFLTELKPGDTIIVDDEFKVISDISSNTTLNVDSSFTTSFSNKPLLLQSKIDVTYKVINKELFLSRKMTGVTSGASCLVEKTSFDLINNRETLRFYVDKKTVNGTFAIGEKLTTNIFVEPSSITATYIGNGVKKQYNLLHNISKDNIEVYVNNTLVENNYIISNLSKTITFDIAPNTGSKLEIKYKNVFTNVELSSLSELKSIQITDGGANYNVGDPTLIVAPGATRNPVAVVRKVFYPKIESIRVLEGGCGFQPGGNVTVNGIDLPLSNVKIGTVFAEPFTKSTANSFVVYSDVISDIDPANTLISTDGYGLSSLSGNLNTAIHYSLSEVEYFNIGEIIAVEVGDIFFPLLENPTLRALPAKLELSNVGYTLVNTTLQIDTFGSLGKIIIEQEGTAYSVGDEVVFTQKPMCLGIGAEAEVTEVGFSGQILNIDFVPSKITGTANVNVSSSNVLVEGTSTSFETELKVGDKIMIHHETRIVSDISSNTTMNVTEGFTESFVNKPVRSYNKYPLGGQGYTQDKLPDVTISSVTGSNASIKVIAIMGAGDIIQANVTPLNGRKVGAIEQIQILDAGEGFTTKPSIDMSNYGSGNAKAEAVLYSTFDTYEGKWLSTESIVSSADRKLQGLNYYTNHSYVISSSVEYRKYKSIVKNLLHPAGYVGYAELELKNEISADNVAVESQISNGASQIIRSVPFNVNVNVTQVFTNNVAQNVAINVQNFLINQHPGFNNVTFNVAQTSIITSEDQYLNASISIANTGILTGETDQLFSINTDVPRVLYGENDINFGVFGGVVITSAELSSTNSYSLIGNVSSGNSIFYYNLYSSNNAQLIDNMNQNNSILNAPNTAQWPITFI